MLLVVAYHFGATWLPGGFIGVDVFFVISGYLITSIIWNRSERGDFSFADFYTRRVFRLIPALTVVVAFTVPFAFLILPAEVLASYGRSVAGALLGYSNIIFWMESSYFDPAASLRPLLHTWSLSVEWQFYAVWPVLIVVLYRLNSGRKTVATLALIAVASLIANLLFQDDRFKWIGLSHIVADGPSTIFYNMPFRAYEFAIGALIYWLPPLRTRFLAEGAFIAGLALIAYSGIAFNAATLIPSVNSLIPALGAAAVIFSGKEARFAEVLRMRPVVYLGKISYSIYLVHWPLIVFLEACVYRKASAPEAIVLAAITIAAGAILHHFVEVPFHARKVRQIISVGALACTAILFGTAASVDGMAWRISKNYVEGNAYPDLSTIKGSVGCSGDCRFGTIGRPKVLIVGDSHIDHLTRAIKDAAGGQYDFHFVYSPSCFIGASLLARPPGELGQECSDAAKLVEGELRKNAFDAIIIGQRWPGYRSILTRNGDPFVEKDLTKLFPMMLEDLERKYHDFKGRIVIVGHAPTTNSLCKGRPYWLPFTCPATPMWEHTQFQTAMNAFLAKTRLDVRAVMPVDIVCRDQSCDTMDDEGHPLYVDDHHLSIFGSKPVAARVIAALRQSESPTTASAR